MKLSIGGIYNTENLGAKMRNTYEEIKGKNILITGGTTGIGRATAKIFSQLGGNIMIFGRTEQHLNDALSILQKTATGKVHGIIADVAEKSDIERIFTEFDKVFGNLDILVNNAALPARSVVESNYEEMEYVLNVNILGYLACSSMAIERMRKTRNGHIVNIGSLSAKVREEDADLYVTTKSAIEGFSESLRKQVNKYGIKVSVIEPGSVGTNMVNEPPREQRNLQEEYMMLKAEDIAEAIIFCVTRPKRADVICLEIRPHHQFI